MDYTMGYRLLNLRESKATDVPFSHPTTADVANETEISIGTINALENDKNANPKAYMLINLAKYYGVTTDYILGLSPDDGRGSAKKRRTLDEDSLNAIRHLSQQGQQATLEHALMLLHTLKLKVGEQNAKE